jgi:hypothetical protein
MGSSVRCQKTKSVSREATLTFDKLSADFYALLGLHAVDIYFLNPKPGKGMGGICLRACRYTTHRALHMSKRHTDSLDATLSKETFV